MVSYRRGSIFLFHCINKLQKTQIIAIIRLHEIRVQLIGDRTFAEVPNNRASLKTLFRMFLSWIYTASIMPVKSSVPSFGSRPLLEEHFKMNTGA